MNLEQLLLKISQRIDALERATASRITWGTVAEIDFELAKARIEIAPGVRTPLIPWIAGKAGATAEWAPPEVGEQVLVFCPGNLEYSGGVFICGIYSAQNPAPANSGTVFCKNFGDGARIEYDTAAHTLTVNAQTVKVQCDIADVDAKQTVTVKAGQSVVIDAPMCDISQNVNIGGNVVVTGNLTAAEVANVAGIMLGVHKHGLDVPHGTTVGTSPGA